MKKIYYIGVFLLCSVITIYFFTPHFALDTYWALAEGFNIYGFFAMLQQARVTSFLVYELYYFLHANLETIFFTNNIIDNIIATICIFKMYHILTNYFKKTNFNKILLFLFSFFIIINPYTLELYYYTESPSMWLSFLATIFAVDAFMKKKYFITFLYLILCVASYQVCITAFMVISIFLLFIKDNSLKNNYKEIIKTGILFIIPCIISVFFIRFILTYDFRTSDLLTLQHMISNIKYFYVNFFITGVGYHVKYIPIIIEILLLFLLTVTIIIKKKSINYLYNFFIIIILSTFVSLSPMVIMKSTELYVSMRLFIGTFMILPFSLLYIYKIYDSKKNNMILISFSILLVIDILFCFSMVQRQTLINRDELHAIDIIKNEIEKEKKDNNNDNITKLVIYNDIKTDEQTHLFIVSPNKLYSSLYINKFLLSQGLIFDDIQNRHYQDQIYKDNFDGIDFHNFTEKNVIIIDDTIYICLY